MKVLILLFSTLAQFKFPHIQRFYSPIVLDLLAHCKDKEIQMR